MSEYLNLDILTPDGRVDLSVGDGGKARGSAEAIEVEGVQLPAALGEMGVKPRHIPFLTPLVPGVVRFRYEGTDRRMAIGSGFLEISEDGVVTLLTERAVRSWEVDVEAVRGELESVRAELGEHRQDAIDDAIVLKLRAQHDWLDAQLRAAQG
jgi:F-type H+-transporting ATPase subunit epsilon